MEIRRLKQELEQRQQELLVIGQTDELKDDNDRIRRDLEESFKLKMSVMQKAEEDARKEMERVKAEAELAARKAVEDELVANTERQRMYRETLEQVKREAREELEKHLRLEKERKEREDADRAKEAEQKSAADAEARRKFQEEEEEKKEKLLRELREEIHAEIKAEKSKSLGSRKTSCRGLSGSRRPSRSETASNVDPFEFFEGYATPYETHTEPSSFEEPVWSRDELAALWSHQARGGHAERKEDPTHSRTNPFGANGIPYDEERVVNGLPAGETSTFLGTQDPQHRPGLRSGFPFAATDGDGEDSDKITVIPAATYRNNMESISGAEPSLEASLAGLDITNTDTTAAVQEPNLAPRHQPVHDRRSSQRINNWPRTPCRGQSRNERAAGGDNSRRKLPHDAPDTDGGVNLQHFETLRPAPSRSESRLSSGANSKGTGLHQASPARSQATRDSPLLPYLAKHLSDFEENASVSLGRLPERSQQPRLMGSKRPEDSFRSDEDTLQGSAARYGDWPPPVGQQFKWPGPASGAVDVQPGLPVAFVPCVMVPLHMLQLPVQGPVLYSGMMMPRQAQ
ncbi:Reticulocyte-binding protein 2-like protein a [Colletotrichum sidae]|uniref:Reticulocyte-binding protein 2-like protein a n=1 Tax=Colletotrichum sidae TaxID=1347389 RepID=A0A4R8T3F9_9PEZI|nr:Reticulocyte-binding protein 2-like protein a [Colletotrichum sidae]